MPLRAGLAISFARGRRNGLFADLSMVNKHQGRRIRPHFVSRLGYIFPNRRPTVEVGMFEGFTRTEIATSGARIHLRHGGDGPPRLLLHGNPLTHVFWHKIAPRPAQRFHVVASDLRGYRRQCRPRRTVRRSAAAASRGLRLGASRPGWRLRQSHHRLQKRSRCSLQLGMTPVPITFLDRKIAA